MKRAAVIVFALWALAASAQPGSHDQAFQTRSATMLNMTNYLSSLEIKPNEIVSGKVTYSGIGVELVKTGRPLQLINPLAPPQYGSPEDNVMRDGISKRVIGWKLFSIRF